jgi:hypothetical protein
MIAVLLIHTVGQKATVNDRDFTRNKTGRSGDRKTAAPASSDTCTVATVHAVRNEGDTMKAVVRFPLKLFIVE